jgi:hypothetical protein
MREGRLFSAAGEVVKTEAERLAAADVTTSFTPIVDQTVAGLNFRTYRDRLEIIDDFLMVVSAGQAAARLVAVPQAVCAGRAKRAPDGRGGAETSARFR